MKKKIIALALSMTMILGMSLSSYAADGGVITEAADGLYSQEVAVETTITTPTIKITVPTSATVALNPYKIKTTVGETADIEEQIATEKYKIKNESNVAIECSATVSAEIPDGSKAVLATAALKGTEVTKSVFMWLEVKSGDAYKTAYDSKATNQVLIGKTSVKKALVTLAAGATEATEAEYTFLGQVAVKPTDAWTDDDKTSIKLVWSFAPVLPE